jgi:hypothetical protein
VLHRVPRRVRALAGRPSNEDVISVWPGIMLVCAHDALVRCRLRLAILHSPPSPQSFPPGPADIIHVNVSMATSPNTIPGLDALMP